MKSGWLDSLFSVELLDNLMACTTLCKCGHVFVMLNHGWTNTQGL